MEQPIDEKARTDLLNRLKRAEGQMRGLQRMLEEGQPCGDIANQMSAVRKALDSTQIRLTVCYVQQRLQSSLKPGDGTAEALDNVMHEMQSLLGKAH